MREYLWSTYAPNETGLKMVINEDAQTGTVLSTTVAHPTIRVAAHRAWSAARQSRSPMTPWEIMKEVYEQQDADHRLGKTFHAYGHASVGDMARLQVDFAGVPMHFAMALFNMSAVHSGQEKSTRYQQFAPAAFPLHPLRHYLPPLSEDALAKLEMGYQSLHAKLLHASGKFEVILTTRFAEHYHLNRTDPKQERALRSRVLDCARVFIPFGKVTSLTFETSARDWSRIIGDLKASPIAYYRTVAHQIEALLAPTAKKEKELGYTAEAPTLLRHTEAAIQTNSNLAALKAYLEKETDFLESVPTGEGDPCYREQGVLHIDGYYRASGLIVASMIKLLYPAIPRGMLLHWLSSREEVMQQKISSYLFRGVTHQQELPLFAEATSDVLFFHMSLAEIRDFNRHRSCGRFIPLPLVYGEPMTRQTCNQILSHGYGIPLYLETEAFEREWDLMRTIFHDYYAALSAFLDTTEKAHGNSIDYSFLINLLPLAHYSELWMYGGPKQFSYLTQIRSRPGGHINYRALACSASWQIASHDDYLAAIRLEKEPDPTSREEFLDRT